jgi:predicted RNA-binding Zn-ribbon protein involved in translation (DUF1610 family)
MSIEWLLTKATDTEAQRKALKRANEESGLSDKVHSSKPGGLNRAAENDGEERQLRDEDSLGAKMQCRHFEIDLRCDCGYEGTATIDKMDSTLSKKRKKGFAYFECPNCKRHLQYDCLTGKIKTKKGILKVLLGRFS